MFIKIVKGISSGLLTISLPVGYHFYHKYKVSVDASNWDSADLELKTKSSQHVQKQFIPSLQIITEKYDYDFRLKEYRKVLLSYARGLTLQVCSGVATNNQFYTGKVKHLLITDIFDQIVEINVTKKSKQNISYAVDDITHSKYKSNSFDTVVSTFGLAWVADVHSALREIKRLLKPKGRFLIIEQGLSYTNEKRDPDSLQQKAQQFNEMVITGKFLKRNWLELVKQYQFNIIKSERVQNGRFWVFILQKQ